MIVLKKIQINKNIPTAIYNVFRDPCYPNIQNNIKYLRKILIVFLADLEIHGKFKYVDSPCTPPPSQHCLENRDTILMK